MPGTSLTQTHNTVGGDLAGGDIYNVAGDFVFSSPPESPLNRLYQKLKEEAADDKSLTEYIGALQIFTRVVENEAVVGLDAKFAASGRDDEIDMAKAMKEHVYGELRRNIFSPTFQTIYATLMGKIYEEFQVWVRPAIVGGKTREEIDHIVHAHVVKPVVAELESCSNFDAAAVPIVRGMVYFLTGNCHLRWN